MIVDVATFTGAYPFREIGDTSPEKLLREMDRTEVDQAWVGYLPALLHHDPRPGNDKLIRDIEPFDRLFVVPTIDPGLPGWTQDLDRAVNAGAVGVRVYPMHQGLPPDGTLMQEFVGAASQRDLPVILTVRLEDLRQRHPLDAAKDLPASAVRQLARCETSPRLIVTHAGREYIEEIHFGLTEAERQRVCYDISWLWGPPSDDLTTLCETVGLDRFVWGSSAPLRIMDAPGAKLELTNLSAKDRGRIQSDNLRVFLPRR